MTPIKDEKTGKWLVRYSYKDWQGNYKKSTKRGFKTKREAEQWYRDFVCSRDGDLSMTFEKFVELYLEDISPRIRKTTLSQKRNVIQTKILPYFGNKQVYSIKPTDIRLWQNEIMEKGYSPTYLRTINSQLTAIFNFAVKYYDLKYNPCTKAGTIGKKNADEMLFWTKDEFMKFIDAVMDKPMSYAGFMTLFWTGMRVGELRALTVGDINLEENTININKSLQRLNGVDIVSLPKTPKSVRTISIPDFLAETLKNYISHMYEPKKRDRLFPVSKYYFTHEMERGSKISGVKKIRIHDLRHSHCALLCEMGVPPLEVADRLGHERVETTLNIYAHIYPNKQREISDKLNNLFKEDFLCQ